MRRPRLFNSSRGRLAVRPGCGLAGELKPDAVSAFEEDWYRGGARSLRDARQGGIPVGVGQRAGSQIEVGHFPCREHHQRASGAQPRRRFEQRACIFSDRVFGAERIYEDAPLTEFRNTGQQGVGENANVGRNSGNVLARIAASSRPKGWFATTSSGPERGILEFLGFGFPGDPKCLQQSASRVPAFGHGAHRFQRFTQPVHSEESLDGGFHRIEEATEGLLEQTQKSWQFVACLRAHAWRRFFRLLSQPDVAWFQTNKHQVKSTAQAARSSNCFMDSTLSRTDSSSKPICLSISCLHSPLCPVRLKPY